MICDTVTPDIWYITHDMIHVTWHVTQGVLNIVSKCQEASSCGLVVKLCFEDMFTKDDLVGLLNELMTQFLYNGPGYTSSGR